MASNLFRVPAELAQHIISHIPHPDDMVHLDHVMQTSKSQESQYYKIKWKDFGLKHAGNLLKNPLLAKQIKYNRNDEGKWDNMQLYPSSDTRLPTDFSYRKMILWTTNRPLRDLDGKLISLDDIQKHYQQAQVQERRRLVFMLHMERVGDAKPSDEAKAALGMDVDDLRWFQELLHDARILKGKIENEARTYEESKVQGKDREKAIKQEWNRDVERIAEINWQNEAFQRFFHRLVLKTSFHPSVCMGCLAEHAAQWVVEIADGSVKSFRGCVDCSKERAKLWGVSLICDAEIAKLKVVIPKMMDADYGREGMVGHVRFGRITYTWGDRADQLCKLQHGESYAKIRDGLLSAETLSKNAKRYRVIKLVLNKIWRLHAKHEVWTQIVADPQALDFLLEAKEWVKTQDAFAALKLSTVRGGHHAIGQLANSFWEFKLWSEYGRLLKTDVLERASILCIDRIEGLGTAAAPTNPLDVHTLTHRALGHLCLRIHHKSFAQVVADDPDARKHRLSTYVLHCAILVAIKDRLGPVYMDVLIDVVAVSNAEKLALRTDTREDRLIIFLETFFIVMMAEYNPVMHGFVTNLSEVSTQYAQSAADKVLRDLAYGDMWTTLYDWAAWKQITVSLPTALPTTNRPEFLTRLVTWPQVSIVPAGFAPMSHIYGGGLVRWNCLSDEDVVMHDVW